MQSQLGLRIVLSLDEADQFYVRATEIWEKVLGPDHPQVATALNNRAHLLNAQVRIPETSRTFSPCRADVALLNDWVVVYYSIRCIREYFVVTCECSAH